MIKIADLYEALTIIERPPAEDNIFRYEMRLLCVSPYHYKMLQRGKNGALRRIVQSMKRNVSYAYGSERPELP